MGKEKIFYKWWFQLIVIAGIAAIFIIAFNFTSPTKSINKSVSSYSVNNIQNSPQRVLSAFLRSIYTENPKLLRGSVTKSTIYNYEDDYYNRHVTDEQLKAELHKENGVLKKEFGEKWFYNTVFVEYGKQDVGDGREYVVKVNWAGKKQTYISAKSYGLGIGLDSYATETTFREFLHDNVVE